MSKPAWAVFEYFWYPLLVFLTTPYFLTELGLEAYGHWMLLTAIVSFGIFLNAGTGAAVIKHVSASLGAGETQKIPSIVASSLVTSIIGGGLLAIVIVALILTVGSRFFERMGDGPLLYLTASAAALLSWLEQVDNVFSSTLKGAEEFGRAARIEVVSKSGQILAAVVAISIWDGLLQALYGALLFTAVLRLAAKVIAVKRRFALSLLQSDLSSMKMLLADAKWGWLQGAGGLLFSTVDRLLVGSFFGATGLSYYSISIQLAQQLHAVVAAAASVMFPKVSRDFHSGARRSILRLSVAAMLFGLAASSAIGLLLLIFGNSILVLWLGPETAAECARLLPWLTLAYWLLAANVVPHYILLGLGRLRFVALMNCAAGLGLIASILFLAQRYGIEGVGAARIMYGAITLMSFIPLWGALRAQPRTITE